MPLTPKQQRFVDEYLIDLNATQAAIRAGYSPRTANEQAARLLAKASVAEVVTARREKLAEKAEITQEMIVAELAKIGFSDIRKAVKWFSQTQIAAVDDADLEASVNEGDIRFAVANQIELIGSADIDDATAAAISEVSMSDKGTIKVKFHDKQTALVNLGKHLGMFKETVKLDVTGLADELEAARKRAAA